MSIPRFVRTTHQNGQFRPFPPESLQFWREHGCFVGHVLRPECALTFAELAAACQEYAMENATPDTTLPSDEKYIAWVLIKLLEYGMAEAVSIDSEQRLPFLSSSINLQDDLHNGCLNL